MHGFEWQDVRGLEGTGFVRALRTILTSQLSKLIPRLREVVENHIDVEFKQSKASSEFSSRVLYDVAKRLVAKTNCTVFFGSCLGNITVHLEVYTSILINTTAEDREFLGAASQFPHDSALAAEFIRFLPQSIGQFLARRATCNYRSASRLYGFLKHEVTQRLAQRSHEDSGSIDKFVSLKLCSTIIRAFPVRLYVKTGTHATCRTIACDG